MKAPLLDTPEQADPARASVEAQRLRLRATSPMRSTKVQVDVDGLALFDDARSPRLL
ncbi:MAG: hypothetical protein U9R73_00645 [Pseudomonadota bacterium]|nr:hypothetical protein [Pseudomonadota bacterium]